MKRKAITIFIAAAMAAAYVPGQAMAGENVKEEAYDGGEVYGTDPIGGGGQNEGQTEIEADGINTTLESAVETAGEGIPTVIRLTDDAKVSETVVIPEDKKIILDLNGYSITAAAGFSGRVFENHGYLRIEGGGTIDISAAGRKGYGTADNYGCLEVEDGSYISLKETFTSNFYNRKGGKAVFYAPDMEAGAGCIKSQEGSETYIYGGKYSSEIYSAVENNGYMEITGGEFIDTSCARCSFQPGYTIQSGEDSESACLLVKGSEDDSVNVCGFYGALSIKGGTADIYNGVYRTMDCDKGHGEAYYAAYFKGNGSGNKVNIYGGTFEAFNNVSVFVDGSAYEFESIGYISAFSDGTGTYLVIHGGRFIGGGDNAAIDAEGTGAEQYLSVSGGSFSSDISKYVDYGSVLMENGNGWEAETVFDGGTGTKEDPYEISSLSQMEKFRDMVNGGSDFKGRYIELTNDIDLNGEEWIPIGGDTLYTGGHCFSGSFNGGGHTIYGLKITDTYENSDYTYSAYGLFGAAGTGAEFSDLNIQSPYIELDQAKNAGALLGGVAYSASSERVKILNVNVENARISANGRVGGIIGWVIDSTKGVEISGCSVTGDISAVYNKTADDDGDKAGGILGQASSDCIISDCSYSDGTVSAYREAAGILGTAASGSAEMTGSSVSDAVIVQDKTNGTSDDPKCGQIIGRVGDNNSIAVGGNDFSDHVELISDNSSENGIGSDGAGLEMMSVKIENEYFAGLEEALEAAEDMSGSVKIELIGDLDISGTNINFDLSDSEIERLTICSDGGENRKIMSGVDGNDIDGPIYCPSINIKLPENAELIIRDLTFPDDLSFDSRDGSVLIKDCVFNGSISDYPTADSIEFRDNIFDFDGTAENFYTNNAFPIWYKVQNDMEFVFENNTVKGLRGVHIETSSGKVDMTVDYNRFELKDDSYTNKAIAFQPVGMINGDVSFSSNYVDAYMGVCLFKNIKWIDGSSLAIDNNYIKDGCKLYGSSEWNADGATDSEKEKNADKSAEGFLKNKGVEVDSKHSHEYEDGICIICGHKKQDSGDKESKPSSSISLPEIIRDDKTDKTDKTDKVTNPDGSVTTKTENPDGSAVETTNYADGSTRTVTTSSDGTVTTVLTDGYGNYTDTVEDTYGNKSIMISNVDGSWSETIVNSDGWMKSDVKVPDDKIIKETREQGYVSLPIPIVSNTKDRNKAAVISVDLTGMDAFVEIPVINGGAGTVIIKMQNDGTEEIIKDTVFTGKGVAAEISDGDTIMILDNSKDFSDVDADFWGKDAIGFVTGREIFSGTSESEFDPDSTMTRAMIWTVLARLDGQDVDGGLGLWYEKGQKWAVDNGISDGSDPDKAVSREQLASMLYRYASLKGDVSNKTADLSSFADAGNISGYAVDDVKWAVSEGIISGNGDGHIDHQGKASRAQTAVMIMKLCQK